MRVEHPLEPLYDQNSRILILGSFPSVKSREQHFYYGHPQNRFWKLMARICDSPVPESIEEKKNLLLSHGIALWDVIQSCEIVGSSDSSIRDVKVNDLSRILSECEIAQIFVNGGTAYKLYRKYLEPVYERSAIVLPSSSPANAAYQMDRLMESWGQLRKYVI